MWDWKTFCKDNVQHILAPQIGMAVFQMRTDWKRPSIRLPPLPRHIDCNFLLGGPGEDAEELVQDGGQEGNHHMAFHGMETLHT